MNRLFKLSLLCLTSVSLFSCKTMDYSLYYSYVGSMKGVEVYCWKNHDTWYSGILPGTNRLKDVEEVSWLQDNLPCPLNKMSDILDVYKENNDGISVIIVSNPPKEEELHHTPDFSDTYLWVIEQLELKGYMDY